MFLKFSLKLGNNLASNKAPTSVEDYTAPALKNGVNACHR